MPISNIKKTDDQQLVLTVINTHNERRKTCSIEQVHWLHDTGDVIESKEGKILKILDVVHKIQPDKTVKYALEESEEKYRCLFELSHNPMWLIADNVFLFANDAAVRTLGYDSSDALKQTHPSLLSPEYQSDGQSSFVKANLMMSLAYQHGCQRFEWLYKKLNGEVFPVEISLTRIPYKGQYALFCVWNDISEKKNAQEKVIQQNKLRDALHNSMTHFVKTGLFQEAQKMLVNSVLELTESEYGFTAEIFNNANDAKINLFADDTVDAFGGNRTITFYKEGKKNSVVNDSLNNAFQNILNSSNEFVCNMPTSDLFTVELPSGYPPVSSVLAFPIFYGKNVVGIYGLCNRKNGYDKNILDFLKDVGNSFGIMINSKRLMDADFYIKERLSKAAAVSEQANLAKSTFVANMSHELRTPLNAILGFSQLMNYDKTLCVDNKENVDQILKAGDYLLDLINNVSELSTIESGQMDLTIETVDVNYIIEECLNLIKLSARERKITINYNQLPEVKIRAEGTHFKQVLINLLTNAVKYNSDQGSISISGERINGTMLRIKVADTGNGLTENQLAKVFQPFERLTAKNSEIEGTGIGLTISKKIIEEMNGKIGVTSTVGKGSCFWVDIPLV